MESELITTSVQTLVVGMAVMFVVVHILLTVVAINGRDEQLQFFNCLGVSLYFLTMFPVSLRLLLLNSAHTHYFFEPKKYITLCAVVAVFFVTEFLFVRHLCRKNTARSEP